MKYDKYIFFKGNKKTDLLVDVLEKMNYPNVNRVGLKNAMKTVMYILFRNKSFQYFILKTRTFKGNLNNFSAFVVFENRLNKAG